jgi:hypothetical protein
MINDQTTGLLNHCINEIPRSAGKLVCHWQHGLGDDDQRRQI